MVTNIGTQFFFLRFTRNLKVMDTKCPQFFILCEFLSLQVFNLNQAKKAKICY